MSFLSYVRDARECYRIERPGEEQMNNSLRLSHHLGGLDESWLFVAPVVARRAEDLCAQDVQESVQ